MRTKLISSAVLLFCLPVAGCLVVTTDGSTWCWRGTTVWAESTETLTVDTAGVQTLAVQTHNGAVVVNGQSEGAPQASPGGLRRALSSLGGHFQRVAPQRLPGRGQA